MNKIAAVFGAALLGGMLAASSAATSSAPSSPPSPILPQERQRGVIRVESNLVNILVTVIDANGEPIADLTQDAFDLSEEGIPQKIVRFEAQTNRPLDLELMVDSSLSTFKDSKIETDAAGHFIRQVIRPSDTLALFEFAEHVTELEDFSGNVSQLENALKRLYQGSGTSMYDALVLGGNAMKRRPAGRRRAIVLVTDAGETTSYWKFDDARRAGIASDALLYSIVIQPVKNESGRETAGQHALITITDSTGGAVFLLDNLGQLDSMFDRINRELRTQYLLGYYPNPVPPSGSDRHVQVKVKAGSIVRYRKEYFTAGAPE
jgi:Ca-activated chloride channel family protein